MNLCAVARVCVLAGIAAHAYTASTFTNPLLESGPDPWVAERGGYYYFMRTMGKNLTIWKTRDIADLKHAERKVVWIPPKHRPYSKELWAPELHYLQGAWYIYFAADSGENSTHRLWVVENRSPDPLLGDWTLKGELTDASDKWAIDPTVFEWRSKLYVVWSGWPGDVNGTQDLYIAQMKNPWTIEGRRVMISAPQYAWEEFGDLPNHQHVNVNEGPEILQHGSKIFLIYSASGCWTDHYELGMLTASADADLLDARSWKKSEQPVFVESPGAHAYGPGHNGFFKSPDGTEDWIIYHANAKPHEGCRRFRSPRAQRFAWNADGTPNFGNPVPIGEPIQRPSGASESGRAR